MAPGEGDRNDAALVEVRRLLVRLRGDIDRVLELIERSSDSTPPPPASPPTSGADRWVVKGGAAHVPERARETAVEEKWAPPS